MAAIGGYKRVLRELHLWNNWLWLLAHEDNLQTCVNWAQEQTGITITRQNVSHYRSHYPHEIADWRDKREPTPPAGVLSVYVPGISRDVQSAFLDGAIWPWGMIELSPDGHDIILHGNETPPRNDTTT